jgi:small neutral amino acid transporter SnatA (MarC family)
LLPRDSDPTLAHDNELELSLSLSIPFVTLPSGANGENVFLISVDAFPIAGGPLRALMGMVKVGRGPNSSLGTCLIRIAAALLM